ncbi:MAG: AbrB/MazE/SpoVT family DNA-binding domain-containing protein [Aquincola sp.]|nr:AbrB/MazE/SpoVT family DNA-binding domain-containing protein [Aquincola sp.]
MMTSEATLTSKGQVTLPKELRVSLGLEAGAKLSFSQLSDGTVVMRVKHRKLSESAGMLTRPGQPSVPLKDLRR